MSLGVDVRATLEDSLLAAGLPAFRSMPATVAPPAIIIAPDSPYMRIVGQGPRPLCEISLRVTVVAQLIDTEGAQSFLEELVDQVIEALPSGYQPVTVSTPGSTTLAGSQGSALAADISVLVTARRDSTNG